MMELWLFLALLTLLVLLLVVNRRREARRLRSPTRDALSPDLREEIEAERERNAAQKKRFEEALRQARGEKD